MFFLHSFYWKSDRRSAYSLGWYSCSYESQKRLYGRFSIAVSLVSEQYHWPRINATAFSAFPAALMMKRLSSFRTLSQFWM